jgi:hypothetical protein
MNQEEEQLKVNGRGFNYLKVEINNYIGNQKKTIYIVLPLTLILLFAFETPQFITKKNDIHLSSINKVFVAETMKLTFHPHRKLTSTLVHSWKNYS